LLFFLGIALMVHLNARKTGLHGADSAQLPPVAQVLREGWYYPIPLILMIAMLAYGYSPGLSAFYTCLICVAISWFRKNTRMGFREIGEAFLASTKGIMAIAGVAGAVGIIVGILSLTGLALKFSSILISWAGGSLFLTIVMVALAALVLGTGTPITAVYLILAIVAPKALTDLGMSLAAAHLMIIWFSQLSGITPPVCIVAYSAAAIAKADPFKTGFKALRYGMFLIIIPLLFAYTPILLEGETFWENLVTIATSAIAVVATAVLLQNFLRRRLAPAEQVLLLAGSIFLFGTNYYLNAAGTLLVVLIFARQFRFPIQKS
jgi:TRAP transporter 4TM/12TM fusion protein